MKKIPIWNNEFAWLDLMIWRQGALNEWHDFENVDGLADQMFAIWHGLTDK